jgi:simple sugar transport system substrate-binding protein
MQIIKSETGEFMREKGKEVMEAFLRSPEGKDINALFSHNDDMAIGAIQAIEAAGKKPGKDIVIVSVDGVHDAFEALKAGTLNCTVECNPLLGPGIFDLAEKILAGEKVDKIKYSEEGLFDETNYQTVIDSRKY